MAFQRSAFQNNAYQGGAEAAPPPAAQPSGASGRKKYQRRDLWPVGNLDLETWRKRGKKLEARIEAVQKKIQRKREETETVDYDRKLKVLAQLQKLQEQLLRLLGQMDEIRKAMDEVEMEEAMLAYLAYRRTH